MSDLLKVGVFAAICVAFTAIVIAWFNGPAWYAIGPGLVFAAYVVKLIIRKRPDDPRALRAVLFVVSVAMILFAWFKRGANI
jgi:hypothetical protein